MSALPTINPEAALAETLLRDLVDARKAWADAGENDHRLAELSAAYDAAWERAAAHVSYLSSEE